jgi:hypothetical protein
MEEGLEWSVDRDTHAPVRKAHGGSSAFCTSTSRSVDASTRQGWIATGVLPLAFTLRLPHQAYYACQDSAMRSHFSGAGLARALRT